MTLEDVQNYVAGLPASELRAFKRWIRQLPKSAFVNHGLAKSFPVGAAVVVTRCFGQTKGNDVIKEYDGVVAGYTSSGIRVQYSKHQDTITYRSLNGRKAWQRLRLKEKDEREYFDN